jgi:predicted alpha/beta superfamily hydrolase
MLLFCFIFSFAQISLAQDGVTGVVQRHAQFFSRFVAPRNIDVWLPPGYTRDTSTAFPVIYMHDGQNLFDPKTSYSGVDWGIDETMTRLIRENAVREAIIVGIWNTPKRVAEYMPQKAASRNRVDSLTGATSPATGVIISDNYLKFIVYELKPFIDSTYRTRSGRENTFIMGSSRGGLISAYAIAEYPEVFGGAGCVSTHWPADDGSLIEYLKQHLPDFTTHKFYFDYGTATLDSLYEPYQKKMDLVMENAGFTQGRNWITRKFVGEEHSERSWRKRAAIVLTFLLQE